MDKLSSIAVKEVMTTDIVIVGPDDPVSKVEEIFRLYPFHHLPVVEEGGKLLGLISKEDFLRTYRLFSSYEEQLRSQVRAREIMVSDLATITPETTLYEVARVFVDNLFHALPVVRKNVLLGLVTTHDLIRYCIQEEMMLN